MKYLITDEELCAYADGTMDADEMHALEVKASKTGQTDLLLAVVMANYAIQKDEAEALWGKDTIEVFENASGYGRMAASKKPDTDDE